MVPVQPQPIDSDLLEEAEVGKAAGVGVLAACSDRSSSRFHFPLIRNSQREPAHVHA